MSAKELKLQFLEEKIRLLRPYLDPQFGEMLQQLYSQLRPRLGQLPSETFLSGDHDLEKRIDLYLSPDQAAALRKQLVERFGFSSIGRTPARILQEVLSKGKISNEREARVVLDRLADQIQPGFGSEEYVALGKIMAEFEKRRG